MCLAAPAPPAPATAAQAVAMVHAGLGWLATADAAGLGTAGQAGCLRGLEQAESVLTAARAQVLRVFDAQGGYEDDGHGSARSWLRSQTRVTRGAADGAIGWIRRLAAHPAVAAALAAAEISQSWARQICDWSDLLPEDTRADADQVLLAAAAGGADLADLAALAEEMRSWCARPDTDGDDGFAGRRLWLDTTFGGAGTVHGDLTPACAAALTAVLDALGKRAGPEDLRSASERRHDALEEACRRLIAAGCLPGRGGQPTQILLHLTLERLRGLPGASNAEAAWAGAVAGPGADCDATIIPIVTGHIDPILLDQLALTLLATAGPSPAGPGTPAQPGHTARTGDAAPTGDRGDTEQPGSLAPAGGTGPAHQRALRAAREIILAAAADLLSGPGGLAAYLRTGTAGGLAASASLPLDVGAATETIPAHLRRAVTTRDRRCRFPGCTQPPAACEVHHITPRARGGPTKLTNLLLLCTFHHLIAVHRWGWSITLHPDATVTATSPDHSKTLHSHSPPAHAA